jgi:hypothetical protein
VNAIGEPTITTTHSHFQWSAIFGGAVAAAGASLTLNAFAAGIGLSVVSSAPTWRDSSAVYWLVAGVFLLFVSLVSFSIGGYIAGRMRAPLNINSDESEFRDGMHGLATWGSTVVLAALLMLGAAAAATSVARSSGGSTAESVVGEIIIATELDDLFRTTKVVDYPTYRRAEAARILLKSASHEGVPDSDRNYLAAITSTIAGVPEAEAEVRVSQAISASTEALHRARVAAVLQAFFVAAALFVGAVVAWFAATEGGQDREQGAFHFWEWSGRRRT